MLVVGNVLGAGIYAVTGEVAAEVGDAAWLAFATAFGVAALSALALCELVTKYPGAAGVALYVDRAFARPMLTFVVGFAVLASGLTSAATAARAFGGDYLAEFVTLSTVLAAAVFIAVLGVVNYWGIIESLRANVVMTLIEVIGLLLVIAAAATILGSGDGDLTRPLELPEGDHFVPLALLSGTAVAFFSFLGFEDTANMSEEVRRPRVSYPAALFGGLALTAVLYIAVVYGAAAAVGSASLEGSTGPLLTVVEDSPLGLSTRLFAAIALVAVANTALANLVMGSRLLYGMAMQGLVPRLLGAIDPRRSTPWVSVIVTAVLAFGLAASGDIAGLARTTVLLLLTVLVLMNVSAIILRSDRVEHDHFRAPRWAPFAGALACGGLVVNQIATGSWVDPARALVVVAVGVALYAVERAARNRAARRAARAEGD
jgi:APA family basic amino acid/polyamine antiporter